MSIVQVAFLASAAALIGLLCAFSDVLPINATICIAAVFLMHGWAAYHLGHIRGIKTVVIIKVTEAIEALDKSDSDPES